MPEAYSYPNYASSGYTFTFPSKNYHIPERAIDLFFAPEKSEVAPAKIRVTLSRPLTWAEFEYLTQELPEYTPKADQGNRQVIHFSGNQRSRQMYDEVAGHLANEFVNVYPKAVLTKREYGG